jgi:hypothetical protein
MSSWRCSRSRAAIVGSIQIEMSGALPSSHIGTHTRYSFGRAVEFAEMFVNLVTLSFPATHLQ